MAGRKKKKGGWADRTVHRGLEEGLDHLSWTDLHLEPVRKQLSQDSQEYLPTIMIDLDE
jgi:hypothetical protein